MIEVIAVFFQAAILITFYVVGFNRGKVKIHDEAVELNYGRYVISENKTVDFEWITPNLEVIE